MNITGTTLRYRDEEEHILRRLGWAATIHWKDLEEPIKQLLLKQAVMTSDRDPGPEPVQLEQNIKRFLEEYARADQHAPLK